LINRTPAHRGRYCAYTLAGELLSDRHPSRLSAALACCAYAERGKIVREGEERLARQFVLIRELKIAGRHDDAEAARDLLPALTDPLRAARRHLQIERETNGIGC
jgi:hypothetical protein